MLTWPGRGLYVHSPRADSAYDAPQAGKTVVILTARWENPWLLVIEPRTTAELGLGSLNQLSTLSQLSTRVKAINHLIQSAYIITTGREEKGKTKER